ncbi:uncharacterized protein ACIBXB_015413 [Morphnus guianensis]
MPAPGLSLPLCGAAAPRLMTLGAAALRMLATPSPGPPPAPLPATPSKGSAARPETLSLGMWGGSPGPRAPFWGWTGQKNVPNPERPPASPGDARGTDSTKMVLGRCLCPRRGTRDRGGSGPRPLPTSSPPWGAVGAGAHPRSTPRFVWLQVPPPSASPAGGRGELGWGWGWEWGWGLRWGWGQGREGDGDRDRDRDGDGDGDGDGVGDGDGDGDSDGNGDGNGDRDGDGHGAGDEDRDGDRDKDGDGDGDRDGDRDGDGDWDRDGDGDGERDGDRDGNAVRDRDGDKDGWAWDGDRTGDGDGDSDGRGQKETATELPCAAGSSVLGLNWADLCRSAGDTRCGPSGCPSARGIPPHPTASPSVGQDPTLPPPTEVSMSPSRAGDTPDPPGGPSTLCSVGAEAEGGQGGTYSGRWGVWTPAPPKAAPSPRWRFPLARAFVTGTIW